MRILLDTNILVSAIISKGAAKQFFALCFLSILVSKFHIPEIMLKDVDTYFKSQMIIAPSSTLPASVAPDKDDDNIIAAAVESHCDYIITGDKDLLGVREYAGVKIVSMQEFRKLSLE